MSGYTSMLNRNNVLELEIESGCDFMSFLYNARSYKKGVHRYLYQVLYQQRLAIVS